MRIWAAAADGGDGDILLETIVALTTIGEST